MNNNTIKMAPIGYVVNDVADNEVPKRRAEMISEIVINDCWTDALQGIEDYSHIFVLFWMSNQERNRVEQLIHPRGNNKLPLTGILATRARNRPNPIGLAVVELLGKNGNRLKVKRLDAFNGTPILDLKPYDDYDIFNSIRVPEWWVNYCRK